MLPKQFSTRRSALSLAIFVGISTGAAAETPKSLDQIDVIGTQRHARFIRNLTSRG
jgi:hypothetical protein